MLHGAGWAHAAWHVLGGSNPSCAAPHGPLPTMCTGCVVAMSWRSSCATGSSRRQPPVCSASCAQAHRGALRHIRHHDGCHAQLCITTAGRLLLIRTGVTCAYPAMSCPALTVAPSLLRLHRPACLQVPVWQRAGQAAEDQRPGVAAGGRGHAGARSNGVAGGDLCAAIFLVLAVSLVLGCSLLWLMGHGVLPGN
jgi:hypothetical protein